ncbi:hypothetical protein AMJ52_07890 [candidate division TA06 bacterium DG_78]|uniref:SIMPL domain-containing protein n=1 Tax=candidate division TA06 bacterium DG_78 TaxID=1703772 RepID=A0A0S7YB52_UNCT6|nr:MAG: hypothetical protein AMJ52_07890 [candidate division TA06 bacterium DG_78]
MSLVLILSLICQTYSAPNITLDRSVLSVTGQGMASIAAQATKYEIVLYADAYAEEEAEAREMAKAMKKEIIKVVKKLGGKEDDVVLTNINTLEPIEEDPHYGIEQDIQIWLHKVKNINKIKEQFLLIDGVSIGSVVPIIDEIADYAPAIKKARKDAVKNANEQAQALASEMHVILGALLYAAEDITYPTYTGYETSSESDVIVSVTVYYEMLYKK